MSRTMRAASLALVTGLLLLLTTGWLYAPGTSGPILLDDRSSVSNLDVVKQDPQQALELILSDRSGPLGRPVAVASFVAERLFFAADIAFSKSVNIALHLFNAILVAWLFLVLFSAARYPSALWLAVLAGGLWLVAPLFVSTVLYAVQRMAMLATTFMLLTMLAYVHWRQRFVAQRTSWPLVPAGLLFFTLGIFSKETAVVVLPVLVMLELMWFSGAGQRIGRERQLMLGACCLLVLGALCVAGVFLFFPDRLLGTYVHRDFTPNERALTQTRILWDYVSQFFLPEVQRMGLVHDDIELSRSLTIPAVTLKAVLGWLAVLAALVALSRYAFGRRISFGIVFFLLGHSTESTILPLDLYYEHRNYFPAIGLALLVVAFIGEISLRWKELSAPLLAWLGLALVALSLQTSSQVQIWSSAPLLRLNDVIYHPNSFRANSAMAVMLAEVGAFDSALEYSLAAHNSTAEPKGDHYVRNLALACMAGKQLPDDAEPGPQAIAGPTSIKSVPNLHLLIRSLSGTRCLHIDRLVIAETFAAAFLGPETDASIAADIYSLLGMLENELERYYYAYQYTGRLLELSPESSRGLLMQLHFTTALGKAEEAESLKQQLLSLQSAGKLSLADQKTLALYL